MSLLKENNMSNSRRDAVRMGMVVLCSAGGAFIGTACVTRNQDTALAVGAVFAVTSTAVVGLAWLLSLPFRRKTGHASPVVAR